MSRLQSIYEKLRIYLQDFLSYAVRPEWNFSWRRRLLLACAIVATFTLLRAILHPFLGSLMPFLFYVPAVVLASAYAGARAGLLATFLSVLAAWFFWTPPFWSLRINDARDIWLLVIYFIVAGLLVLIIASYQSLARLQARTSLELEDSRRSLAHYAADLELMVKERTTHLQRAVEDLETFSYAVSHDLRSPLRSIYGFAMLLREDHGTALSPEALQYLEKICASTHRMDALVKDVVAYSQVSLPQLPAESLDLRKLLESVLQDHPSFKESRAQITIHPSLHRVLAAPATLSQVITNLLSNAVKFAKPGQPPRISIWTEERTSLVRVWVEDQGVGIPQEALPRIFEPFKKGNPNAGYEGIGFGLTIVRKAVEKMGGQVGVESQLGQGTRFWVELPAPSSSMP